MLNGDLEFDLNIQGNLKAFYAIKFIESQVVYAILDPKNGKNRKFYIRIITLTLRWKSKSQEGQINV